MGLKYSRQTILVDFVSYQRNTCDSVIDNGAPKLKNREFGLKQMTLLQNNLIEFFLCTPYMVLIQKICVIK